jgi:hypothetical protein
VKPVKRKAKSAALIWKELYLTAGYHSHTAPAANGSYCITPTFEREVFNGYLVSQVDDCDTRYLCGAPGHGGTRKLDEAKAIAQVHHDGQTGSMRHRVECPPVIPPTWSIELFGIRMQDGPGHTGTASCRSRVARTAFVSSRSCVLNSKS